MAGECANRQLQRTSKKHPSGVISGKKCQMGKKLQQLPAVKAWSQAVKEQMGFKKGEFVKIPKRGTAAHKALLKRQKEILDGKKPTASKKKTLSPKPPLRRGSRVRKQRNFFGNFA